MRVFDEQETSDQNEVADGTAAVGERQPQERRRHSIQARKK